jgi:hypothetical protein
MPFEEGWQRLHTKVLPIHGPSVITAYAVATLSGILNLKIVINFGKFKERGSSILMQGNGVGDLHIRKHRMFSHCVDDAHFAYLFCDKNVKWLSTAAL